MSKIGKVDRMEYLLHPQQECHWGPEEEQFHSFTPSGIALSLALLARTKGTDVVRGFSLASPNPQATLKGRTTFLLMGWIKVELFAALRTDSKAAENAKKLPC